MCSREGYFGLNKLVKHRFYSRPYSRPAVYGDRIFRNKLFIFRDSILVDALSHCLIRQPVEIGLYWSYEGSLVFLEDEFQPLHLSPVEKCLKMYFYVSTKRLNTQTVNIASMIMGRDSHVFPGGTTSRFTYERLNSTRQLSTSNANHTTLQTLLALFVMSSPLVITRCT